MTSRKIADTHGVLLNNIKCPALANLGLDDVFEATKVATGWFAVPDPVTQAVGMPKP